MTFATALLRSPDQLIKIFNSFLVFGMNTQSKAINIPAANRHPQPLSELQLWLKALSNQGWHVCTVTSPTRLDPG